MLENVSVEKNQGIPTILAFLLIQRGQWSAQSPEFLRPALHCPLFNMQHSLTSFMELVFKIVNSFHHNKGKIPKMYKSKVSNFVPHHLHP